MFPLVSAAVMFSCEESEKEEIESSYEYEQLIVKSTLTRINFLNSSVKREA